MPTDIDAADKRLRSHLLKATRHLRKVSEPMADWIARSGPCRLTVAWDRSLYEALVRAIAHQQLHGKAAETILGRLCAGFRGNAFPSPRQIASAPIDKLRSMGFSAAKTVAIQGIANATLRGDIPDRHAAESMSDEELIECLVSLRGVGRWTVEMLLIFTLGRLDVMPADDYGVRSGLQHLVGLESMPKKMDFDRWTAHWAPYRTVGAWYLWRKADSLKPTAPVAPSKPSDK